MFGARRRMVAIAAGTIGAAAIAAGGYAATSGGGEQASDLASAINKRAGTSITADDVTGAFQDLLKTRLDEAVAAGRITQEQADEMLQRAQDAPGLPGVGGPGLGHGRGPGGPHTEILAPVAKKLGITEAQLRTRLQGGTTLTAIAKAEGVSRADLIATITTALTDDGVAADEAAERAAHIADEAGRGPRGPHADVLAPVAKKLGITEAQLRTRLQGGKPLTAIAKAEGVTRAALITTITTALKADGVPADRVAELAAHIADDTRPGPGRGPFGGPRP